jgi:hypothetical protein
MSARDAHAVTTILKGNIPSQQGCRDLLECKRVDAHVDASTKLDILQQYSGRVWHGLARMYLAETREQPIGVLSANDLGSAATVRCTNVTMRQVDAPRTVIGHRGATVV